MAFFQRALERIATLPGVTSASAISWLPFGQGRSATGFLILGRPKPAPGEQLVTDVRTVHPRLFGTLGIPLLAGRDFEDRDMVPGSPRAFVINQSLARKHWPNENPIGQKISVAMGDDRYGEIVGMVADYRDQTLDSDPLPTVFYPHSQLAYSFMHLMVRTAGPPTGSAGAVGEAVRSLDPNQPVAEMRSMEEVMGISVAQQRFQMLLLIAFAAVALGLAAVGIYGVMSYAVSQRTQEIGIRMAIGAEASDVLGMVLRRGLALTAGGLLLGLGLGLAAALALRQTMAKLLFRIPATDPVTFAGVALLLGAIALLAAYIPARRATRVDPLSALRYE